jgi:hypothetical protein
MEDAETRTAACRNAHMRQQLAEATATLDKVAACVRDMPKLQSVLGSSERLPGPRDVSGLVATSVSSKTRQTKAVHRRDVTLGRDFSLAFRVGFRTPSVNHA